MIVGRGRPFSDRNETHAMSLFEVFPHGRLFNRSRAFWSEAPPPTG
jgi:hypothetical protein